MGLMRFIAGAIVVGAVVAYGESDAPAPSDAARAARTAAGFCKERPELCTAAATGAVDAGIEQIRGTPAKSRADKPR